MEPLHDKVFIKPLEVDDKSSGGIIIHGNDEYKRRLGIVQKVGRGYLKDDDTFKPLEVNVGDKVSYIDSNQVHEQVIGDDTILVMSEQNILYVIEE